jgi:hypothetical protein
MEVKHMSFKLIAAFLGLLVLGLAIGVGVMKLLEPQAPIAELEQLTIGELKTAPVEELPEGVVRMEEVVEKTEPEVPVAEVVEEIDEESKVPSVVFN